VCRFPLTVREPCQRSSMDSTPASPLNRTATDWYRGASQNREGRGRSKSDGGLAAVVEARCKFQTNVYWPVHCPPESWTQSSIVARIYVF